MKAVDTNLLLRYIVRDDPRQYRSAAIFLESRTPDDPAFIGLIVLAELSWALRQRYKYSRDAVRTVIFALLETRELVFEEEAYLSTLLATDPKGDLTDHLIAFCALRAGCSTTVTFDYDAARSVPGMELLA